MSDAAVKASYDFLEPLGLSSRGGTTERVQSLLREAIIGFELAPGADIDKLAICERLGVSRFPVSEALARLQNEGLVEILPQRGTRVSRIRLSDVRQSMFIRSALEAQAVRTLALNHRDALLPSLERNLRYQHAATEAGDRRDFHRLDLEFHLILLDALGYARVKAAVEAARANLDRVRRLLSSPRHHALTVTDHEKIVAALAAGDADAAGRAMEEHLDFVITELVAFAAENPALFEDL
ncbi:GntR family transcriptional regulator [Labrys miyagiensis]|uniref:GntR family transcriptional regulator n=1 Tax=Labrys miyagiensis TaxID=346912 RepID=A0ABQ6CFX4_9HYPH|nr:GntR family transcriptional regulator [Labrys miyagiensis]GLS19263.1 GntR family transcriptional regulator [Labrys miyagiensis]